MQEFSLGGVRYSSKVSTTETNRLAAGENGETAGVLVEAGVVG
jgi:hypothetical protein